MRVGKSNSGRRHKWRAQGGARAHTQADLVFVARADESVAGHRVRLGFRAARSRGKGDARTADDTTSDSTQAATSTSRRIHHVGTGDQSRQEGRELEPRRCGGGVRSYTHLGSRPAMFSGPVMALFYLFIYYLFSTFNSRCVSPCAFYCLFGRCRFIYLLFFFPPLRPRLRHFNCDGTLSGGVLGKALVGHVLDPPVPLGGFLYKAERYLVLPERVWRMGLEIWSALSPSPFPQALCPSLPAFFSMFPARLCPSFPRQRTLWRRRVPGFKF